MNKLGKEAKVLLYGITITCVISFLLAFGISSLMAKEYQKDLMQHDYFVAGYLLNHSDTLELSAFTAEQNENDIETGRNALEAIGYDDSLSAKLLPSVLSYRNQAMIALFFLLLFAFGIVYVLVIYYLNRQHKAIKGAEKSIREFLDGNTMCRIESEETGDWYSLFHAVNELSAILSAHADNEKQTKEFLQDIISDVSHQLKTPLSALKMYNEIIGRSDTDQAAVMDFPQKSLREIKRIEDVVYTLLKLARLDAGIIQMQKAPENISVLMQDILERFELWADRENKTITLSGDANITFHCDALWVSEAVGNIVKNALEHTAEGGHITVRWEQTPLLTQIVVEDNGKGIHPEDLYNIFKRFYRSRFSQDVHGIGLGLPLAKTIVESHGGTISVTSKIDVGTTFTLNFFNLTNE